MYSYFNKGLVVLYWWWLYGLIISVYLVMVYWCYSYLFFVVVVLLYCCYTGGGTVTSVKNIVTIEQVQLQV